MSTFVEPLAAAGAQCGPPGIGHKLSGPEGDPTTTTGSPFTRTLRAVPVNTPPPSLFTSPVTEINNPLTYTLRSGAEPTIVAAPHVRRSDIL